MSLCEKEKKSKSAGSKQQQTMEQKVDRYTQWPSTYLYLYISKPGFFDCFLLLLIA
jgi:hypothetical protein